MWKQQDWQFAQQEKGPWPTPMWMDARHVDLIYRVVMANDFRHILEIGCHWGFSTSALVQALLDGKTFEWTLCDPCVTDQLRAVVSRAGRPPCIAACDSLAILDGRFDLVIVDGDHRLEQVSREAGLLLYHQTPTIIAHDVAWPAIDCAGAVFLGDVFKAHGDYEVLIDRRQRIDEYTQRGFMIATRNVDVHARILPIWHDVIARPAPYAPR